MALTVFVPPIQTRLQLRTVRAERRHASADPMFGIRREDVRNTTTFRVEPTALRLYGFIPVFEFGVEDNQSTLPLNNHEKVIANLTFRKAFR